MSRIIDFSYSAAEEAVGDESTGIAMFDMQEDDINLELEDTDAIVSDNINLLKDMYPRKIMFSLEEVSQVLNVSYEYIRTKTISGQIKCIKYGDRKMIHLHELALLISKGV